MKGTPFGQYRLIEMLGRGGMGEVWRAYDTATDRVVALKLLPSHFAADDVFKRRFRREAHAAARLSEPHVVPIHTYGEIERRLFVDMRLINGRDLGALIAAGPLPPARAVGIIEQAAKALQATHDAELVHRDVKPTNILVTEDDFAYLIDFGIARAAGAAGSTTIDGVIGTVHYMAPERFTRGPVNARSDIYSLACVLHECLTGSCPFPGDSMEQQLGAHLATPPPRPSSIRPSVPAAFDDVIAKGMAKEPSERYATIMELARAARHALVTSISSQESLAAGHPLAALGSEPDPPVPELTEQPDPVLRGTGDSATPIRSDRAHAFRRGEPFGRVAGGNPLLGFGARPRLGIGHHGRSRHRQDDLMADRPG